MKKILEISIREDGMCLAGCELETELDCKRLGAAFLVLAHENRYFAAALAASVDTLRECPDAGELVEISKQSAAAMMFGSKNKNRS